MQNNSGRRMALYRWLIASWESELLDELSKVRASLVALNRIDPTVWNSLISAREALSLMADRSPTDEEMQALLETWRTGGYPTAPQVREAENSAIVDGTPDTSEDGEITTDKDERLF